MCNRVRVMGQAGSPAEEFERKPKYICLGQLLKLEFTDSKFFFFFFLINLMAHNFIVDDRKNL